MTFTTLIGVIAFFALIGALITAGSVVFLLWLLVEVIANIVCVYLGTYRVDRMLGSRHKQRARIYTALRCWSGARYSHGYGFYLDHGGQHVPLDIRDPIEHFYGA